MPLHPTIRQPKATPVSMRGAHDGVPLVPQPTPLTRNHYFDGKLLDASHLEREQEYGRRLVHLSNLAGGPGVVYGYDVASCNQGTGLRVGPGYALDGLGRPLLLPTEVVLDVDELVALARGAAAHGGFEDLDAGGFAPCVVPPGDEPATEVASPDWWVLTIGHGEGLCGEEEVYGRLCEAACATDTDRAWRIEGVIARLEPLRLGRPLPRSSAVQLHGAHLRSRVAAAVFGAEARGRSLASAAGLKSATWCRGASPVGDVRVPIAVVARNGEATAWVDPWIVRRDRVDPAPVRWWHPRLGLRPWSVFLAQVLQFQCQLRDAVAFGDTADPDDPCTRSHEAAFAADRLLEELTSVLDPEKLTLPSGETLLGSGGWARMQDVKQLLASAVIGGQLRPTSRILLRRGIVELPPAGFLPVDPSSSAGVEAQVRALMGEGVELRFCAARPDVIAQALDQAQHLARISLTVGLDDPDRRPEVDILVPGADGGGKPHLKSLEVMPHLTLSEHLAAPEAIEALPSTLMVPPSALAAAPLRPVADWVLFVHRSDRHFRHIEEPPAPPRERTFALYTLPMGSPENLERLRELLERGAPLDAPPDAEAAAAHAAGTAYFPQNLFVRLGEVRFSAETDELRTSVDDVQQMWGPMPDTEEIGGVLVAAHPGVESAATNRARADRTVGAIAAPRQGGPTQVLDTFPNVEDADQIDGVIVVGRVPAEAPTTTTCIQVRRISAGRHKVLWAERDWGGLMQTSEPVGTVEFSENQPEPNSLHEVEGRWQELGGGVPLRQSSIAYRAGDAAAGTMAERAERGHIVLTALGYGGAFQKTQFPVEDTFQGCHTVLFAVVG